MTKPTAATRAGRMAVLLAVGVLLLNAFPARGASAVEIEARALVGGRYEIGGWLAVAVSLVNTGEPTDGYVTAETSEGTVRRFVEMPAGAQKVVMVYVEPDAFQRRVEVAYVEPNGTVGATVEVRVFEQSANQYAVVGDAAGTLRPQMIGADATNVPEPISLAPIDLPERPEPLSGLTSIVWATDSAGLSEGQRRSLERWVADGGQLIVLGGADWQARAAGLEGLLPIENLGAVDDVPQTALAGWAGSDAPPVPAATVATGTLHEDARTLVAAGDGTPLMSMRSIGAGQVVFIGSDLANAEHRGWEAAPRLWARILPGSAIDDFFGGGFPVQEEFDGSIGVALNSLPSLAVPPAELLLAVIAGYILLIGPLSYLTLRRLDRRELAWVTAPLLVVLFSASSYGIGRAMKGSDVIVNQISLIRSSSAGTSATVESYAGVYSPDRATYDVTVDADALMSRLQRTDGRGLPGSRAGAVSVEQGAPAHLRGLSIGVFGFEGVRAVGVVEHAPTLSVSWRSEEGRSIGTVTNSGETALSDVAWISSGGGEMIGDLEPGASAEFTVPTTNFNGTAASDQVYGFGGFESGGDDQRRIQMRREVINGLVGYGGFAPGGFGSASGGRGPYLIGWSAGDGPLPITVDGQETQRYGSLVEVIAARPSIGTGEVTIQPHQMAISVVATEGDASPAGPATVVLGTGSVTFGIALPLEAAGLVPSEAEILVAPDPSFLMGDPGSLGGFWPDGYSVEVRNARSGEWIPLGDLTQRGRFEVEDASTVVSPTGRIEVRVTGTVRPDFGMSNVFASARVAGVIDR